MKISSKGFRQRTLIWTFMYKKRFGGLKNLLHYRLVGRIEKDLVLWIRMIDDEDKNTGWGI